MKNASQQKTMDANTQREKDKRERQAAEKPRAGEAPLKEHGQPAWRDIKSS